MVVYDNDGKILTVKYQLLAPMLLNELQKQNAQLQSQAHAIQLQQEQNRRAGGSSCRTGGAAVRPKRPPRGRRVASREHLRSGGPVRVTSAMVERSSALTLLPRLPSVLVFPERNESRVL